MDKPVENAQMGVALVGAGMIAKTHVAALSAAGDVARLHAVVSRRPERAHYLKEYCHGVEPVFTDDLTGIVNDPAIQMVIVATPPSVRDELISALAVAGKHVLLEKPVGRTTEEAVEVVEICERAGVTLGVLFQHRVRAPAVAAKRIVESGELGRLGLVEIAVPLWRDQSYYDEPGRGTYARDGGGVMITNGIHSLDLALSLTGPVTRVQAMTATTPLHRMEAEDFALAGLSFANGASGSFVASTAMYPHRTEVITLHFEKGSLRMDKDTLVLSRRDGTSEEVARTAPGPEEGILSSRYDWHQAVIEDFIDAVRAGRKPLVTGREALVSHRLIGAIETSSRTGRPVDLPA